MEFVFHFSFLHWKTNGRLGTHIVIYFSCLAKRHGFQGLNLKRQINICFLFFVLKLKNEWPLSYIFVFLRTIVPSWFWCLHDLVLSRLAELPSYVPKCYCLNSLQSEKIKNKLWPNLFGKRNRGSNIVLKITFNNEKKFLLYQIRVWLMACYLWWREWRDLGWRIILQTLS